MKEALGPEGFNNLKEFLNVLEASGLSTGKATGDLFQKEAGEELKLGFGKRLLISMAMPLVTPKKVVFDQVNELQYGKGARKLATALMDPTALEQLKGLKQLNPKSEKFMTGLAVFMGLEAGQYTREQANKALQPNQPIRPTGGTQ